MSVASISARVEELDATLEFSYAEIFQIVCQEFGLDADRYESELGCQCPFGLIGFLSAE